MQCHETSELMSLRLDERLAPEQEQVLQAHVASCDTCHAHWGALQRADTLLGARVFAMPPPTLSQNVMALIQRRRARLRLLRGGVALLLSFVGLLALGYTLMAGFAPALAPMLGGFSSVSAVLEATGRLVETADIILRATGLLATTLLRSASPVITACYAALAATLMLGWTHLVLQPHRARA